MMAPGLLVLFVFAYLPMFGIIIGLQGLPALIKASWAAVGSA